MKKINVITLGCSKNTVDSEHLMAQLAAAGYTVAADSDRTDARVVEVNTCGFIGAAKQESIDMILRAAAAKQAGRIDLLFVVGCLSERYADELRPELPEVDEFFGVKDWEGVVRALGGEWRSDLATERRLTTPRHYAYLKIGEGCDWKCGYCAIPLIRGPHVSVPMEQVLDAARRLAAGGVRDLKVIAQDTTYYVVELYGRRRLADQVHISVGHTCSDYETAYRAFSQGADHVTHFFNAMPPFTHRAPGVFGAAFDAKHVMPELICDGIHIDASAVRVVFSLFGAERMILISDSMMATGMEDGAYSLGGLPVTVRGNLATLEDGTIAGSATNLMDCMRKAVSMGIPLETAVRAATYNPARAIGAADVCGSITAGPRGDCVLLSKDDLSTKKVIFGGKVVA